jgi:hypothetical protein
MAFSDPGTGRIIVSSGRSPEPGKVVLAEACKAGDILGYSSGWKRSLAAVGGVIQGRVVALKDGLQADEIPVSPDPVVGGYSGATPGNPVYVAEGTDYGKVTETAPSHTNDANKIIGYVLTATTIQFCVLSRADSLA